MALAWSEGLAGRLFTLEAIGGHVRLLLVIPLFFFCEQVWDPRASSWVPATMRSGLVPESAVPALESAIRWVGRWKDSWLGDALCLLAAVLLTGLASPWLQLYGTTAAFDPSRAAAGVPLAGRWYWFVCLPVFRFLMLRWLWRLGLWSWLLRRMSKLELDLVPTHPDRAGGLGSLELVHTGFVPLVVAISALQSAAFAEEISAGTMTFPEVYPALVLILVLDAMLVLGPLLVFSPKLIACRVKGLPRYMGFAARYVREFDRKWLSGDGGGEPLLGTADLQSLADLGNSVKVVKEMRWLPVGHRLLLMVTGAALLPMLPLLLLRYPVAELSEMFLRRLAGL